MSYLAYGICWATPTAAIPTAAVDWPSGCEVVEADGLAMVVSPCQPPAKHLPEVSALLAFAAVVDQLHRLGPLLPIRYGTMFPNHQSAQDLLRQRADSLRQKLQSLGDCEEATISFVQPEQDWPTTKLDKKQVVGGVVGGIDYLRQRRQIYQQKDSRKHWQAERLEQIRALMAELIRDLAGQECRQPPPRFAVQLLIERGRFAQLHQRFAASALDAVGAKLTGPYPCWHFGQLIIEPTTRCHTS